jgi:hypothetical protein
LFSLTDGCANSFRTLETAFPMHEFCHLSLIRRGGLNPEPLTLNP